jgi:hypothetical protein
MGILDTALSRLIDNRESIIEEARRAFDAFDFDAAFDALTKKGSELYGGFNDFMKTVKDTVSDFKIVIPFDGRYEKFKYEINGDTLKVRVDGKHGFRETSASIPDNCKTDEIRHFVNDKKRLLIVVIPKTIKDDKSIKEAKEKVVKTAKSTADWIVKVIKDKRAAAESVAKGTTPPTSSPKRAKRPTPVKKVVRDAKGRFVSTK